MSETRLDLEQQSELGRPDFIILIVTLILLGFGLVMIYSSSHHIAYWEYQDSAYFLKRQLVWAFLGLLMLYITMNIPYRLYRKLVPVILLVLLVMMVLVLVPGFGLKEKGAQRWLNLGVVTLQPSEFVKLGLIMYLASIYSKKQGYISQFKRGVLPPLVIVGLFFGLTLLQRDLGTASMLMLFTFVILFCAGARMRHMLALGLMGFLMVGIFAVTQPYRLERLTAFLDPWADPLDTGYHTIQSLYAIGNGGLWGMGFNNSIQKQFYLPEPHTDFIFAVVAEEWGLVGVIGVLLAYLVLILRGIQLSLHAPDAFGMLLGIGISGMIGIQALINIGVVSGSLPVTGLTLPFLSYGGSSLLLTLVSTGILLNISRYAVQNRRKESHHEQNPIQTETL
ncbi:cell division protein FtsW [Caldalkalibacillus thermarum TA2.A1]|uniref:Probable peptidoglycan glycosyltransferase FtsW n=1 Tax=Caldalkalibacillus thermarum (strain TA2.A1) TaxID=986075 RepID=F5LAC0_CALTT|nr:putative lipid II flippase FtsW [Caldalkalibacillus thermarum]EGL81669.1 cell division protein FtsW [Caldalkalibacillus thermarum TA2.A1]QZT33264.1 putative lipid II flippase FtsW [Caldalkalibacillus thermarum TA2.A1]